MHWPFNTIACIHSSLIAKVKCVLNGNSWRFNCSWWRVVDGGQNWWTRWIRVTHLAMTSVCMLEKLKCRFSVSRNMSTKPNQTKRLRCFHVCKCAVGVSYTDRPDSIEFLIRFRILNEIVCRFGSFIFKLEHFFGSIEVNFSVRRCNSRSINARNLSCLSWNSNNKLSSSAHKGKICVCVCGGREYNNAKKSFHWLPLYTN